MDNKKIGNAILKSLFGIFGMALIGASVIGTFAFLLISGILKEAGANWNASMILFLIALIVCFVVGILFLVLASKRKKKDNNQK